MNTLSKVLREGPSGVLIFRCPGCDSSHAIQYGAGPGPRWGWNGNADKPTFTPSVLVRYAANPDADEEFKEWRTERICHSFVTDGQIKFLSDSTHELSGQTVPLADWVD